MAASTGSARVIGTETDGDIGGERGESLLPDDEKAGAGAPASPASAAASPHDERYLFHQVARVMPFMLWVCRPSGETHYISPQWVTYTGAPLDLHLGYGWFDFLHPDDRAPALEAWQKAVANVATFKTEFRVRSADGRYRWFESVSVPVRDRAGAVVRWMGSTSDVNDARETRRALLEERDRFLRLAETVPGAVHAFRVRPDRSSSFPFATAAIESIYGVSREALAADAKVGADNIHPDDFPYVRAALEESERDLTPFHCEWRMLHPQRGEIWVEGHSVPTREPDGGTLWYGVIVEVTERKRAEEAQRRSQRIEALGRLAGGIAHDFNNILLAISGNARLALAELPPETPADSPLRASVLEIEKASARAADLVHRILAFSRQNEPKREVLALRQPVEEALHLLRATLPAMIEIRTRFSDEAPAVCADSTQIHQIVMNLVTNAAYAIGMRAGRIDIAVDSCPAPAKSAASDDVAPGAYACLTVKDDGAGMDRATLERIFDPFFTTKPAGQGTGLGLSVVHGIVRSHQGTVAVESEPGKGSTFRLYFPAAIETARAESSAAVSTPRGGGERVLYVDDEEALVYLTSRVLERMGYEVVGFSDPVAALEAFRENPAGFDVVVTDLSMPGMSGFHFARALLQVRPDVSVLMTSGYVRPEDRDEARALGVRELILKPDTIDELGLALARVLKQSEAALSA
jgi:PAS domain S-box-containing protein